VSDIPGMRTPGSTKSSGTILNGRRPAPSVRGVQRPMRGIIPVSWFYLSG